MKKEFSLLITVSLIIFAMISGATAVSSGTQASAIDKHIAMKLNTQITIENNYSGLGLSLSSLNYDHNYFQEEKTNLGIVLTAIKKGKTTISLDIINEQTGDLSRYNTDVAIY
jgi:hypothetical protein